MAEQNEDIQPKHPYSLPDKYPVPRVTEKNPYYASLLLEDYAGISGELTAITQYIYHSITLESTHPAIARLTRHIAITEMHHSELLGKTIQLLGKFPVMRCIHNDSITFWSAKFVDYGNDVYDKLTANIQHEAHALHSYKTHLRLIADPFVCELIERIILDEEYHLRLFSRFQKELYYDFY